MFWGGFFFLEWGNWTWVLVETEVFGLLGFLSGFFSRWGGTFGLDFLVWVQKKLCGGCCFFFFIRFLFFPPCSFFFLVV